MSAKKKAESDKVKAEKDEEPASEEEEEDSEEDEEVTDSEYESSTDEELEALLSGGDPLKFRMYRNSYPAKGDIVVVEVKKIQGIVAATCQMLEYNNLEAMLLLSELQRRRIRSVKKVIKEGRQEIVRVIKVNKDKQFVDLSKKRVDPEDIPPCEEKWNKSKASHSIMRQVAVLSKGKSDYSMKQLYKLFGWEVAKDYGHLYDGFKSAFHNWDAFLEKYPDIPEDVRDDLKKNIDKRLKPQMVTVRAKVEITCFTVEGVEAIKRGLRAGLAVCDEKDSGIEFDDEDTQLKIKLVAPPLFTVSVSTYEPDKGTKLVNKAVEAVKQSILESKGTINIKQSATVIRMDGDS